LIKVDLPSGRSVRNHDGSVGAANALVLTLMLSIECEMLRDPQQGNQTDNDENGGPGGI
jgi:hypothetical protein